MKNLQVYKTLVKAKALIDDPKNWTQGAAARDNTGKSVNPYDPTATRFCMIGALIRATEHDEDRRLAVQYEIRQAINPTKVICISLFNDHDITTHEQVIKVFDLAIKRNTPWHVRVVNMVRNIFK